MTSTDPNPPILEMRGITKRFFGRAANDSVTLALRRGQTLALLGENGAGKSTLMKILYGLYCPDAGTIHVQGKAVRIDSPADAIRLRIGMVHQHFTLVSNLTVAENVILGARLGKGLVLDMDGAIRAINACSEAYGMKIDPSRKIWQLSVGERQRVEILKALCRGADILVLDEPTAVLTPQEADELFKSMDALKREGRGIIFISHKLEEVMEVADRVVVLRNGRVVMDTETGAARVEGLAEAMVGRQVVMHPHAAARSTGRVVLEVRGLKAKNDLGLEAVAGMSFSVREGEIFGFAGVSGNGQRELAEALSGARRITDGDYCILGERMNGKTPRQLFQSGVGRIPEDRMETGAILDLSLKDNLVLESYYRPPFARGPFLVESEIGKYARSLVECYSIKAHGIDVEASTLSGGNLQKAILARVLARDPKLIIASQPTRGLDVGAAEFVHARLLEARARGAAILLISEDLDEILALADAVGVVYEGKILGSFKRGEADAARIGMLMAGVAED